MRRVMTTAVAAALLAAAAAGAQVREATVVVRGMSCPFCAFGVEKKLGAVPGVGRVKLTMKTGRAELRAVEGGSIELAAVPGAVRKAGFTPGALEAVATGVVRRSGGGFRLELPPGDRWLELAPADARVRRALEGEAAGGGAVTLRGAVDADREGGPLLRVASVEAAR